ncbi:MAG: chitobiase/beta-hexosaminidase C-terminal domain-containing protein [Muribaculaceae bacterium]|nr:chitobiase/beta-hexosaminidase C-terminal domain-containing protein [Muribaculaceae bacterium]
MKKVYAFLLIILMAVNAWAAETTYTHSFADGDLTLAGGEVTLSGVAWNTTAATDLKWVEGKGLRIGMNISEYTFSTTAFPGVVKRVIVNGRVDSGYPNTTLQVSVGGTSYIDPSTTQYLSYYDPQDIVLNGYKTGEVVIRFNCQMYFYINSITVVYDEEADPNVIPGPTITADGVELSNYDTVERGTSVVITFPTGAKECGYRYGKNVIGTPHTTANAGDVITISTDDYESQDLIFFDSYANYGAGYDNANTEKNVCVYIHDANKLYDVYYNYDDELGTVEGPQQAKEGDEVTFTVTPAEGYEVGSVVVYKDILLNTTDVTDNGDGTYTFVMPAYRAEVEVTFKAKSSTEGELTTVTFTAGVEVGSQKSQGTYEDVITKDGITFTGHSTPLGNTDNYRVYKGKSIEFSTELGEIVQITFTSTANKGANYGPDNISPSEGTYTTTAQSKVGEWVGKTADVTFTASNQARFTKIDVTVRRPQQGVATPVISGVTPFAGSTEVTITVATEGAAIYYTLDGSDPTAGSTPYEAPFTLTETTTVKAIAILDTVQSGVATMNFVAMPTVANIAEFLETKPSTAVVFANPVTVIAQTTSKEYTFVQDESSDCGLLIYRSGGIGQAYDSGDVIPAGFSGSYSLYNSQPELVNGDGFVASTSVVELVPLVLTPAQVTADNVFRYAVISGATISDGNIVVGEESVKIYDRFQWTAPDDLTKAYDIYGVTGIYGSTLQFMPLSYEEHETQLKGDVNGDGVVSGADVTSLYNVLLDGTEAGGDADVNGDGVVSGADVTALYNLLLN